MITPYHDESGRLRYYHVEYGRPNKLPPANAAWSIDSSQAYTACEWHLLYPDDPHFRDAAILSLLQVAHSCARRFGPRYGADLFSVGVLTIVKDIGGGVGNDWWSKRLEWRMKDWLRRQRRGGDVVGWDALVAAADAAAAKRVDTMDPSRLLGAVEAWESCHASERSQRVLARKAAGWTEQAIAIEEGVKVGVVKRIVAKMYERLEIDPANHRTRAPGRGLVDRTDAADETDAGKRAGAA
jgi:hypothetical protein